MAGRIISSKKESTRESAKRICEISRVVTEKPGKTLHVLNLSWQDSSWMFFIEFRSALQAERNHGYASATRCWVGRKRNRVRSAHLYLAGTDQASQDSGTSPRMEQGYLTPP